MVSKPCPRAGRDGCRGTIVARDKWRLNLQKTCSKSCAWHARVEAGWIPNRGLTREHQVRGARIGGRRSGDRRHKVALARAVEECADLIPKEFERELSARGVALVKVLLGKAFRIGYSLGDRREDNERRAQRHREKGKAA